MKWQQLYESCAFERNLERLNKLVFETEDAIYLRSRELSKESHIANEVQALREASKRLLEIKIEKLGWADPRRLDASTGQCDTSVGRVGDRIPRRKKQETLVFREQR